MPSSPNFIDEPARRVEVIHHTDVLVVGSGPSGLAAALAAARAGVEVTLVERFGCFGGNITVVGVEGFAWYRHEATVEAGGIGGDRIAHAATRNMACCAVAGQGAGVAAALSLKAGRDLAAVDIAAVQAKLERQGVRVR